jgi:hypothetical protein
MKSDWSDIRDRTTWSPEAFTSRVYEEQMSGKPRLSGARAAFEYFHIPDDEEEHRLLEYAERKQEMVVRLIEAGDFTAYPDALRFIIASRTRAARGRRLLLQERRAVPSQDPAGLVRRAGGDLLGNAPAGSHAARLF